jgi:hypothetical protein
MRLVDRTGIKYGRLTATKLSPIRTKSGRARWECVCDCGESVVVQGCSLATGNTESCGCLYVESRGKQSYKHGGSETAEYFAYNNAKRRCSANTLNPDYSDYGGRGIKFLYSSFEEFIADVGPRPSSEHSIDRIDTNGNYEPGNCRWATKEVQAINQRLMSNNTSGYRGVTIMDGRYLARLQDNGIRYALGLFDTAKEAALAFDAKALELRGSEAKLNFPPKKPSTSQGTAIQIEAA